MQLQPAFLAAAAHQGHDVHLLRALAQGAQRRADAAGLAPPVVGLEALLPASGDWWEYHSSMAWLTCRMVRSWPSTLMPSSMPLNTACRKRWFSQRLVGPLAPQGLGDVLRHEDQQLSGRARVMKILLVALDDQHAEGEIAALQRHAQPLAGGRAQQLDQPRRRPSARPAGRDQQRLAAVQDVLGQAAAERLRRRRRIELVDEIGKAQGAARVVDQGDVKVAGVQQLGDDAAGRRRASSRSSAWLAFSAIW